MYDHAIEEMVAAGVAEPLDKPTWQDRNGHPCSEQSAYGCMVTHRLTHPEMCLVGDEVGGNLSQAGDGHAGGRLCCTARGAAAYQQVSTSEKKFTMIGLTCLDGRPIMCVLILQGKKKCLSVETGIDITVEPEGDTKEKNFFFNNCGTGKYFPGPPKCEVNGVTVPALIRWNESATITSEILVDMLATIDVLKVFPRTNNVKPYLLIDGHQSRLGLPFLQYINTPADNWIVCVGVPYGTVLWQVEDSEEQNGSFNVAMGKAKQDLVNFRRKNADKILKHLQV